MFPCWLIKTINRTLYFFIVTVNIFIKYFWSQRLRDLKPPRFSFFHPNFFRNIHSPLDFTGWFDLDCTIQSFRKNSTWSVSFLLKYQISITTQEKRRFISTSIEIWIHLQIDFTAEITVRIPSALFFNIQAG